jgi:succinylarginine dihydrolase
MNILVPMDSEEVQEAKIVPVFEVKKWAMLVVEEGELVEVTHQTNREDFEAWAEAVVVMNDNEPVGNFIDEQIMVLVAHTQRSIDDIVEAYLFRELHELAY